MSLFPIIWYRALPEENILPFSHIIHPDWNKPVEMVVSFSANVILHYQKLYRNLSLKRPPLFKRPSPNFVQASSFFLSYSNVSQSPTPLKIISANFGAHGRLSGRLR